MKRPPRLQTWMAVLGAVLATLVVYVARRPSAETPPVAPDVARPTHAHLDHSPYFTTKIATPQDVTRACLRCHEKSAAQVMKTPHWLWLGDEVTIPGHEGPTRIGKQNLLNNFCLSVTGNLASCTKCHAGYGWSDTSFDFAASENVDCLVCHERSGQYVKGSAGVPDASIDLASVARTVGFPTRENCGVCHNYGGGGQAVKHGDLDSSLENPSRDDDVHMGSGFLCIDCHKTREHRISGRAFSVSVEDSNGVACTDCHRAPPHRDPRINTHLAAVACQTCHISSFSRKLPTKTFWDWSKAGDPDRAEDPHEYLKIKGEFVYGHELVPEYGWFDRSVERYLVGDRIDPAAVVDLNRPRGDVHDPSAKIWPFKVHRAIVPYDVERAVLIPPVTSGAGGFWHDFDWAKALRLGAEASGLEYSGKYGWAKTAMYWPLSHMVEPKERALTCERCHGDGTRLDWAALGYEGDPIQRGGRR